MSTLHELRFALSQATPGEWDACRHATPEYHPQFGVFVHEEPNDFAIIKGEGNTEFIVLAHNMMPLLLNAATLLRQYDRLLAQVLDSTCYELDEDQLTTVNETISLLEDLNEQA